MKNRRSKILLTLCIAILCTAGCSSGAEKKDTSKEMIEKTITFTTKDTKRDANHNFDAIIQKDGKTYELQNVDYDLLNSKEYTKEFTKTVESDILSPEQSYTPDSEIVENEITYQLTKTDKKEIILEESAPKVVSSYTDYSYAVSEADVPATKNITTTDDRSGKTQTVTCNLVGISKLPAEYKDSYIDIVYESYDADSFIWGDSIIPKNEQTPDLNPEQLLASVGASPDTCQIERIYWTGQPYTDDAGILCRNARADVRQTVNYYRASYSGSINQAEQKGVQYISTYTGEIVTDMDYQIKATAHYKEQSFNTDLVVAGIGFLILTIFIVVLLFLISKRKKEKGES